MLGSDLLKALNSLQSRFVPEGRLFLFELLTT